MDFVRGLLGVRPRQGDQNLFLVKVDWTGTTQTSDFQPGLCGTSTRSAASERRGSMVSTADQNRRVEIWLVPKGTKLPAAFSGAKTLDERTMKRLGCPK